MKRLFILSLLLFLTNFSLAQSNDSLVFDEYGKNLSVYKNINNNTFYIKKRNRVIWKNLKFVFPLYGYIQVLSKNNEKFYLDQNGKKENKTKINISTCGTVPHYTCRIIEKNDKYIVTKDETFYDYNNEESAIEIESINENDVDKIYFTNFLQELNYDENDFIFVFSKYFPEAIIVEKNNRKGILYNHQLDFYDEIIQIKNWQIKIKNNGKIGFYGITNVKYSELEDFVFGLAKFKLENGKTGYVDVKGKEYYD